MKSRTKVKICNVMIPLLIITIVFLLILLFYKMILYPFYNNIYAPSKASTDFYYGEVTEEELEEKGIYLGGSYYPGSGEIEISPKFEDTKYEEDILKHEVCHKSQDSNERLHTGCGEEKKLLMNEIECKSAEYLPMFIYKRIYGNI